MAIKEVGKNFQLDIIESSKQVNALLFSRIELFINGAHIMEFAAIIRLFGHKQLSNSCEIIVGDLVHIKRVQKQNIHYLRIHIGDEICYFSNLEAYLWAEVFYDIKRHLNLHMRTETYSELKYLSSH